MKLPLVREEIKVKKWPFIIFIALYLLFFLFVINVKLIEDSLKWIVAGSILFIVVLSYIVMKVKIVIDNTGIVQQILIGKQKELEWQDIKSTRINWEINIHGAELSWDFIGASGKTLRINPSYYSRRNLKMIAEALLSKCAHADLDKRIFQMAEGKFPWYIF